MTYSLMRQIVLSDTRKEKTQMGFTGTYTDLSTEQYIRMELTHGFYKPIANKGAKYWVIEDTKTGRVFAVVVNARKDRSGYLLYKMIDEHCGPYETGFPVALLKMLTAPENDCSANWRKRVLEAHATKKTATALSVGDTVKFTEPIVFTSGYERSELVYDGGYRFHTPGHPDERFRLSKQWKTRYTWVKN